MEHTARLAQLAERRTFNPVVVGSIPTVGTLASWRSGLARLAHNQEVGGSNPPGATVCWPSG